MKMKSLLLAAILATPATGMAEHDLKAAAFVKFSGSSTGSRYELKSETCFKDLVKLNTNRLLLSLDRECQIPEDAVMVASLNTIGGFSGGTGFVIPERVDSETIEIGLGLLTGGADFSILVFTPEVDD